MVIAIDITNRRFGKLIARELIPEELRKNSYKRREWSCECDCGNEIIVEQRHLTTRKNPQQSCGCIRIKSHLVATSKFNIDFEYVDSFDNFDRYAFLHKSLVNMNIGRQNKKPKVEYKEYIEHFYFDLQFNAIYNFWKSEERTNTFYDLAKPSVDHIIPLSKGGEGVIPNLQFLTLFENLNKRDMTMMEWISFKINTGTKSKYYIESILDRYNVLEGRNESGLLFIS